MKRKFNLNRKNKIITVFGYNFPHRKTVDFIIQLYLNNYKLKVIAQNFKKLPCNPTAEKPKWGIHPKDLCKKLEIEYFVRDHNESIELLEGIGVVAGARILSKEIVNKIPIINLHPGLLPQARGLNAVERSLEKNIPLGVTAHIIDEKVDAGEILFKKTISMKKGETIEVLKERIYQLQLEMLVPVIRMCLKKYGK